MSEIENGLRMLLRDSDEIRALIPVTWIPNAHDTTQLDTQGVGLDAKSSKRMLAVISHRDSVDGHQEGSLFILQEKAPNHAFPETLVVQQLIPICGEFNVSITQMKMNSTSTERTGLKIIVRPNQHSDPLSFFTYDAEKLPIVLSECRRLKKLSEEYIPSSPSQTYSWLTSYSADHTLPLLTSTPPDIRAVQAPLHTRLSPASAGSPGDDANDLLLLRDDWVRSRAREQSRKGKARLNIRTCTFNVNGQPPTQSLASWVRGNVVPDGFIPPVKEHSPFVVDTDPMANLSVSDAASIKSTSTAQISLPDDLPDVLVFAFQELDLSTEALIYTTGTLKEEQWCTAIFEALGEHQVAYSKVVSKQLVGILIVMIARTALVPSFVDIKTCSAGVGIMGLMGNKGGAAIQMTYKPGDGDTKGGTVLTFVNSHLAAFDEMVDKRNSDFQDLSRRLVFGLGEDAVSIWESDVIWWMGDLNYRLEQPDKDVRDLLSEASKFHWARRRNIDALLAYDQLKVAMRGKRAFEHFSEFLITHLPSYRFSPGIQTDSLGYDIKRKPAWTDRILNIAGPAVKLQQSSYSSHPDITQSDHLPVSADFTLEVDEYDEPARLTAGRNLHRQLDGLDQEGKKMIVDPPDVDFGDVRYKQKVVRKLRLRHSGKAPCAFRFVPSYEGGDLHPTWLTVEPAAGIVLPQESFEVTLTALVDENIPYYARRLDCTLVLHAVPGLGKDTFIVVQGNYQTSCAGTPLSQLVELPGPIRTTLGKKSAKQNLNAPREVIRLVNWMMDKRLSSAFATYDIDLEPESQTLVSSSTTLRGVAALKKRARALKEIAARVRECLDTGAEFEEDIPAQAYGSVLLELLEGVVPRDVQVPNMTNRDQAFEALDVFPIVAVNVWISVTAFLHYIVQQEPEKLGEITSVLAPVVLSDVTGSIMDKRRFVQYFIQ